MTENDHTKIVAILLAAGLQPATRCWQDYERAKRVLLPLLDTLGVAYQDAIDVIADYLEV